MDMKNKMARKTYEQFQKVRQNVIDTNVGSFFTADEVVEKFDYVADAVINSIIRTLGYEKQDDADNGVFEAIMDGLEDGDTFDYVLKKIDLNRGELDKL